jgi:hypothetical protein
MRHLRRATLALPGLLLATGLAIPMLVGLGRPEPARVEEAQYAGKTAVEWHALAMASLEGEAFGRALRYLKTAERVEPGEQYAAELADVRRARRRAIAIAANRERMLGGDPEGLELDEKGVVLGAYRSTVALPGESLWSLAGDLAAARRGLVVGDLPPGDEHVYAVWDVLTDLNGLRELEVGDSVSLPLSEAERAAISLANAADLEAVRLANAALDSGRVDEAQSRRDAIAGDFVLRSDAVAALDVRIRQSRVGLMLTSASGLADSARLASRTRQHGQLVSRLRRAREVLEEVRALTGDVPESELERVEAMLSDAERFKLMGDGSISATKPEGVAYTDFARGVVEWFLDRGLVRSGEEYPNHALKTPDEIAWARYLKDASDLAAADGVDFAAVLVDEGRRDVRVPNPGAYFEE